MLGFFVQTQPQLPKPAVYVAKRPACPLLSLTRHINANNALQLAATALFVLASTAKTASPFRLGCRS